MKGKEDTLFPKEQLHEEPTILVKSPGTLCTFGFCNELSSPSPPETMLVFWRSTCDNGKISRARQLQVSHKRTNIVLGGRGVHVCSNYENMQRKVVFYLFLPSVPRTFGDYCTCNRPNNFREFQLRVHVSFQMKKQNSHKLRVIYEL